jgi:hypothetical protein
MASTAFSFVPMAEIRTLIEYMTMSHVAEHTAERTIIHQMSRGKGSNTAPDRSRKTGFRSHSEKTNFPSMRMDMRPFEITGAT